MSRKKMFKFPVMLFLGGFVLALNLTAAPKPPTLQLKKCTVPPRIDGKLDDQCWKEAAKVNSWYRISVDDSLKKNKFQQAFVCADNKWLYIAFIVNHPAPATIKPVAKKHDGRVQIENCIKILFDPGTDFNPWYIFRLSAGNVRADQRNLRVNGDYQLQWDIPWRSATSRTKTGWIAETAIPLASLYQTGRIDCGKTRLDLIVSSIEPVDGNTKNMKKVIYSWSPVMFRYWVDPRRFGYLKGLNIDDIRAPFLPQLKQVVVSGGYRSGPDGKMYYTLDAVADTLSGCSGKAIVQVRDMPDGGKVSVVSRKIDFSGGASKKLKIKIPVKSAGKRDIKVALISAANGEVWQKMEIKNPRALNILSAFTVLSFYTSEKNAKVSCSISLDGKSLAGACLKVVDADGRQLSEAKNISKNFILEVPVNKLRKGKNPVTVKLENSSGVILGATGVEITRLTPKPGYEVKIDRGSLSLVKGDKPFVPFGIWGVPPSLRYFKAMKAANINTLFAIRNVDKQYFQDAVDNNISMIMGPYKFILHLEVNVSDIIKGDIKKKFASVVKGIHTLAYNPKTGMLKAKPFNILHLRLPVLQQKLGKSIASSLYNKFMASPQAMAIYAKIVNICKVSPATLAYMVFDEPMIPLLDEDVAGMAMYKMYHKLDPYRPVMVNFCGKPPEAPQATTYADIVCCDSYGEGVKVHFRVAYTLTKRCRSEKRVPWMILKAERVALRRLLPQEQNAQLYACIIAGVKGFYYFNFPVLSGLIWDNMAKSAGEIKRMKPFLITPPLDCNVKYSPGKYSLDTGVLPDVLAGLLKSDDGRYLLLLVNCMEYPIDIDMELPFAKNDSRFKSFRDKSTIKLSGKSLREKLERYGVRAYVIGKDAVEEKTSADSFNMKLVMKPYKHLAPPLAKPLNRFSGDKKNMIANSSFEKTSFPGWPDYFYPFHIWRAELEKKFHLDKDNPFHGKQSLRMTAEKGEGFSFFILEGADGGPKSDPYLGDPNVEYTFSVYMRGDGMTKIKMRSEKQKGTVMGLLKKGHVTDVVVPPKEWKRYSWKITIPSIIKFSIGGPGSVWLDALQLEKSEKPTKYVEQ